MIAAAALAVAVTASSVFGISIPADGSSIDQAYPIAVRQGLSYSHQAVSDDTLRSIAHTICSRLEDGSSKLDVASSMLSGFNQSDPTDPMTPEEAGYMIGASTAAYCPSHVNDPIAASSTYSS